MRLPSSVLMSLVLAGPSLGADFGASANGTAAAPFLKLGVGARAAAMGEAYSAVADEATALYWNPAALTQVPGKSATLMHAAYIGASFFDYAAYAQNLKARGAVGAGVQFFSAGSVRETDSAGADIGSLHPNDLAITAGYARAFDALGGTALGASGKYIRSTLITSAQTEAADVGVLSPKFWQDRLRFALTATNLGGKLKYDAESQRLPSALRVGSRLKVGKGLLLAADAAFPNDGEPYGAFGTEYAMSNGSESLALRAGVNTQTLSSISGISGVSFGVGFGLEKMSVDYAIVPLGGLGQAHRVSLTFAF